MHNELRLSGKLEVSSVPFADMQQPYVMWPVAGHKEPVRAALQSGAQAAMLVANGETLVTLTDARNPSAASAASS